MTAAEEHREYLWNRGWALAAFIPLLFASVPAGIRVPGWGGQAAVGAIALALMAWHAWWILRHPQWWERALAPMAVYFIGAVTGLTALVTLEGLFVVAVFGFFPMAFVALPGLWSYAAVAVLSILTIQGGPIRLLRHGVDQEAWPAPVIVTAVVAGTGAMMRAIEREAIRRRRANAALSAANAELVALAADNASLQSRLFDQARQTGIAEERARIARDIHDTVAQGLNGIVTQLETAEAETTATDPALRRMGIARDLARDSLVEVRRSVAALRPAPLAESELTDALAREVDGWRDRTGIGAVFTVTGAPRPAPELDAALLRAVQEALSNVARHAGAGKVGVTLSYMEDMVVVDVRDDGDGFDAAAPPGDGFGLTAMRQRVQRLGGNVHIESSPGSGTAVSVGIPFHGGRS
ncbi:MAG: sensor histidine kinase [Stackebrandtia sp.]